MNIWVGELWILISVSMQLIQWIFTGILPFAISHKLLQPYCNRSRSCVQRSQNTTQNPKLWDIIDFWPPYIRYRQSPFKLRISRLCVRIAPGVPIYGGFGPFGSASSPLACLTGTGVRIIAPFFYSPSWTRSSPGRASIPGDLTASLAAAPGPSNCWKKPTATTGWSRDWFTLIPNNHPCFIFTFFRILLWTGSVQIKCGPFPRPSIKLMRWCSNLVE